MQRLLLFSLFIGLFSVNPVLAQLDFSVRIDSATINTVCSDLFSGPDLTYQLVINDNPVVTYDFGANNCFRTAPDTPYDTLVNGACNLPATVEVCVRAFDNDGNLIPCFVLPECFEQVCVDLPVPTAGTSSQEQVSLTGSTSGEFYFTLEVAEDPADFNYICSAVDLGIISSGATLGDASAGIYDNSCADNLNEVNPVFDNNTNMVNDHGVWFTYTSGPDVSTLNYVRVFSDPQNTGDPIDLELLVYTADDCTGQLSRYPLFRRTSNGDDAAIELYCMQPNTTLYILVDGRGNIDDTQQGVFSIEVEDTGLPEGGDLKCDAFDLGLIPDNGAASLPSPQGNFCAGFSDDPPIVVNFNSRNSVWVRFEAPASGHIMVEGFSVAPLGIDLELALYQSTTDECNGVFQHLYSGRTGGDFNESFTFSCLDPGRPYWVLIDGSGLQSIGYFDMTITDLGDIRPVFMQTDTICAGESIMIGTDIVHDETGVYTDTVKIGNTNCDSIIITDLTVLEPIAINFTQTRPAIGSTASDGEGMVNVTGGTGDYTISWCDGSNGTTNVNLLANTQCCINVTDTKGCMADTCFTVDFIEPLAPSFTTTAPNCNGESNGGFEFQVTGDRPIYNYQWANGDNSLTGSGILGVDGEMVSENGLPAGIYTVVFSGLYTNTTFDIEITEPPLLTIAIDQVTPISCFQACDGAITVTTSGGTGVLNVVATPPASGDGCAGTYTFTVTDENGCMSSISETLIEPAEFIATVSSSQNVSCFDGDDGTISVTTNGNPVSYAWSNNDNTATINGLTPGTYTVTITNSDGCQDTISHDITQPEAPLEGAINELQSIICAVDQNGMLGATFAGGTTPISYQWSTGDNSPAISGLGPDNYGLTLTDALGCEVILSYLLEAPLPLVGNTEQRDLRCFEPVNAGEISIPSVSGGVGPYLYSLDGTDFGMDTLFTGLEAGRYDITIQDALGCELQLPTSVLPPPVLVADLGRDQQILLGDSLRLNVEANSTDLLYNWSFDTTSNRSELYLQPRESQTVSVTVRDTISNCIATASLAILVDRKARVYMPTAFSPNGDGINDIFYPFGGTDVTNISDFRIFGRYGNLVYEYSTAFDANDPSIGWDGFIRGEAAPIGVYVYTAKFEFFDGRTEVVKGEFTLVR